MLITPIDKIAILGITYKVGVPYTEESTIEKIIEKLNTTNYSIHDPGLMSQYSASVEDCLKDAKIVLIGTPWPEFKDLPVEYFKDKTIIDCYGLFDGKEMEQYNIRYIRLGVNYD